MGPLIRGLRPMQKSIALVLFLCPFTLHGAERVGCPVPGHAIQWIADYCMYREGRGSPDYLASSHRPVPIMVPQVAAKTGQRRNPRTGWETAAHRPILDAALLPAFQPRVP